MQYLHETSLPNMVEQTTGSKPGDAKYESDKKILLIQKNSLADTWHMKGGCTGGFTLP